MRTHLQLHDSSTQQLICATEQRHSYVARVRALDAHAWQARTQEASEAQADLPVGQELSMLKIVAETNYVVVGVWVHRHEQVCQNTAWKSGLATFALSGRKLHTSAAANGILEALLVV